LGIVNTHERKEGINFIQNFGLILEHERIQFITYPHEWSPSMLKDAALFHIDLFVELEKFHLTLKDWHPCNILFQGTHPIFVDFLSIIPIGQLENEQYLNPPKTPLFFDRLWDIRSKYLYEMYRMMYIPYFLLPILLMSQKEFKIARSRIFETTLNASNSVINSQDVFKFNIIRKVFYEFRELLKIISLINKRPDKQYFFAKLRDELRYFDVKPESSSYSSYYLLKNEDYDFEHTCSWTNKQRVIHSALQQLKPDTVLDIACNTGWFSILAAKNASYVIAIDIDETCIDNLYEYAKEKDLPILPLVMDISKLKEEVFPHVKGEEIYQKRIGENIPLLISAEKRLQCDMVLVLALIHHLVLGQNFNFTKIMDTITPLTKKFLIIEFVAKNDNLILGDPGFFSAYKANPDSFDWYTIENLVSELKIRYKSIEIIDSYPETRKIIICKK